MNLDEILESLENLVIDAKRVPLTNKRVIEEDDIADLIDLLKVSIPAEVKKARDIIQERDKIIDKARGEADEHMNRVKEHGRMLVEKEEIYEQAKKESTELKRRSFDESEQIIDRAQKEANEILQNAREESEKIREEARGYVNEMLLHMHNTAEAVQANTQSIIEALEETRSKFMY